MSTTAKVSPLKESPTKSDLLFDPVDTVTHKNHESKKSWNKSSKELSLKTSKNAFLNDKIEESQNCWKNDKNISSNQINKNSSTLSLHIAAYENSIDGSSKNEVEKLSSIKCDNLKLFADSFTTFQDRFEFPRQMEGIESTTAPEIMQFKTSQKLLIPKQGLLKSSSSSMMANPRRAPPRSYLTSAYHIDFHIEQNNHNFSFDLIIEFLISAGKIRQKITDKLKTQNESEASSSQVCSDKTITIGLRQTLKAYNSNKLKWILLDSSTVSPSAVGQVMGLMATNGTKETKFFVIPELSSTISKALNLPKVSAAGFGSNCVELEEIFAKLHPIDIALKKKLEEAVTPTSSSTSFVLPKLEVPKGKTKLSKKQKKKIAGKK